MIFIGDVHGQVTYLLRILDKFADEKVIQIGDMGVGFGSKPFPTFRPHHKFFAGNHDNPSVCAKHPNCLGRYGIWENVFFVSGGYSIDHAMRRPGIDWWADEQLGREEMEEALDLYIQTKPKIVATHDLPMFLYPEIMAHVRSTGPIYENQTAYLFDAMFKAHEPETWVAGHWHRSWTKTVNKTQFRVLAELETFEVDTELVDAR